MENMVEGDVMKAAVASGPVIAADEEVDWMSAWQPARKRSRCSSRVPRGCSVDSAAVPGFPEAVGCFVGRVAHPGSDPGQLPPPPPLLDGLVVVEGMEDDVDIEAELEELLTAAEADLQRRVDCVRAGIAAADRLDESDDSDGMESGDSSSVHSSDYVELGSDMDGEAIAMRAGGRHAAPRLTGVAWALLKILGWKLEGRSPTEPKYVLIAVPHTSNWDFPITLSMAFIFNFEIFWMGKDSLFKGWKGPLMRWMGGIAIDRKSSNNVVQQTIDAFNNNDRLVITIPPEGTRSKVDKWKTGFYYIAVGADVPIGMGYLDYKRKVGGFLPTFHPTGDVEKDIADMRKSYEGITGKFSNQCNVD